MLDFFFCHFLFCFLFRCDYIKHIHQLALTSLFKPNSYAIKFSYTKCTINRFLINLQGCGTVASVKFSDIFIITPIKSLMPICSQSPFPPPSPRQPSVSADLPFLNVLCKWNHTMCNLLHPASFTLYRVWGSSVP